MDSMDLKKSKPMLYDPMIIPRVKQYLEDNIHQTYVDVGVMARVLQEKYREYSRRKQAPFRQLVEHAYKSVLQSYGLDSNPSSDENDDMGSDVELMDDRPAGNNFLSNALNNLYTHGSSNTATGPPTNVGEAIDISSDDSDGYDSDKGRKSIPPPPPPNISAAAAPPTSINQVTITKVVLPQGGLSPSYNSPMINKKLLPSNNNIKNDPKHLLKTTIPPNLQSSSHHQLSKKRKMENNHFDKEINNLDDGDNGNVVTTSMGTNNASSVVAASKFDKLSRQKRTLERNDAGTVTPLPVSGGPTAPKTPKKYKKEVTVQRTRLTFADVGGIDKILKELCEFLMHIKHPEVYRHIGLPPPRGFLLHGPPGCGKTLLAQAIAGQLKVGLIQVAATELVAGVSGESEERIRDLFEQAAAIAPCVLFIDEIDAISSNRLNAQKDMERRIVAQLLSSLDGLSNFTHGDQVLIIGATNRPDSLDPALRRVGRFDQEISLGIPDRKARGHILRVICDNLKLDQQFDFDSLAALTPGYVGADLLALASRAASIAVKRAFTKKEELSLKKRLNLAAAQSKNFDIPTVNLSEDALLMDVDTAIDTVDLSELVTAEPPAKENGVGEKAAVVAATNGDVFELVEDSDTEIIKVGDDEKKADADVVDISENSNSDTIKKDDKPEEKTIDTDTGAAIIEDDATPKDEVKSINETPAVEIMDVTDSDKVADDAETVVEKTENDTQVDETAVAEDTKTEQPIDITDEEEKPEVVHKPQLSLDEMLKWLSNDSPPINERELTDLAITMADFEEATKLVQPSAKREGFITVPDVTWNDIGSLRDIREELQLAVLAPVKFPNKLIALGLTAPSGVLLCGPPGCGKTLLAKAVANEAGINFISVKGPELLNMYVGESERAVRQCFQRARNSAPCVIFFDEFDSLCPKRSDSSENNAGSRVVNQLLTEMDGVEDRKGVFLMAATNRPDIVDPAVLRPGRLDKILFVGLPEVEDRFEILNALTKNKTKPTLSEDVDLEELAVLSENYSGADLAGLVRQASLHALKESISFTADEESKVNTNTDSQDDVKMTVNKNNFLQAIKHIRPSVSEQDKANYEKLRKKYTANFIQQ